MNKVKGLIIEVTVKERDHYNKIEQRVFYAEYKKSLFNLVNWLRDKYGVCDDGLDIKKDSSDGFLDY